MTYHEFKMKAELRGIYPVPENVFWKYWELSLENELLEGLSFGECRKPISQDSIFSLVASHVVGTGGIMKDGWMENVGVRDVSLSGICKIGNDAFYCCRCLKSVTIPDGVTSIGDCAFYGCSALRSVTIPNSATRIGDLAFYGCDGLKSMVIGNGVTSIGYGAFDHCSGLTNVTIPDSVKKIGLYTFSGCSGLMNVTIPSSVKSIGSHVFSDCSRLTSVTIPESVMSIGYGAFEGCKNPDVIFMSRTIDDVKSMLDYPWGIDESKIRVSPV